MLITKISQTLWELHKGFYDILINSKFNEINTYLIK